MRSWTGMLRSWTVATPLWIRLRNLSPRATSWERVGNSSFRTKEINPHLQTTWRASRTYTAPTMGHSQEHYSPIPRSTSWNHISIAQETSTAKSSRVPQCWNVPNWGTSSRSRIMRRKAWTYLGLRMKAGSTRSTLLWQRKTWREWVWTRWSRDPRNHQRTIEKLINDTRK